MISYIILLTEPAYLKSINTSAMWCCPYTSFTQGRLSVSYKVCKYGDGEKNWLNWERNKEKIKKRERKWLGKWGESVEGDTWTKGKDRRLTNKGGETRKRRKRRRQRTFGIWNVKRWEERAGDVRRWEDGNMREKRKRKQEVKERWV